MAYLTINNNTAHIGFEIPIYMEEQYSIYMDEMTQDGAYIVTDVGEDYGEDFITGDVLIEFHKDMYDEEQNRAFMEDIKVNFEELENKRLTEENKKLRKKIKTLKELIMEEQYGTRRGSSNSRKESK